VELIGLVTVVWCLWDRLWGWMDWHMKYKVGKKPELKKDEEGIWSFTDNIY
jgi:hypothetical protein